MSRATAFGRNFLVLDDRFAGERAGDPLGPISYVAVRLARRFAEIPGDAFGHGPDISEVDALHSVEVHVGRGFGVETVGGRWVDPSVVVVFGFVKRIYGVEGDGVVVVEYARGGSRRHARVVHVAVVNVWIVIQGVYVTESS